MSSFIYHNNVTFNEIYIITLFSSTSTILKLTCMLNTDPQKRFGHSQSMCEVVMVVDGQQVTYENSNNQQIS